MATPETDILNQILHYLVSRTDLYCWRNQTGGAYASNRRFLRFGCPGSADILGIQRSGKFIAIEVKAALGRQSPGQKAWQRRIETLGGIYILARSVDDVIKQLPVVRVSDLAASFPL